MKRSSPVKSGKKVQKKQQYKYTSGQYLQLTIKMLKMTVMSFYDRHRLSSRLVALFLLGLIVFSIFAQTYQPVEVTKAYSLTGKVAQLLDEPTLAYTDKLVVDEKTKDIVFNGNYSPGLEVNGDTSAPKITATFKGAPNSSVTVGDPLSDVSVTMTPQFEVLDPLKNENRVVYPILGQDAVKVYTLKASGVKEDIILRTKPSVDAMQFRYTVGLSDGLEMREEKDGSVGVYGASAELLGNVTASTEEDAALLKKARETAVKDRFIFGIPAPIVFEGANKASAVQAKFVLDGNELIVDVIGLQQGNYPLSVDPTIYVESARKLMRGNNETNTDFDVDNELIQKSQTTGARIDDWTSTMGLNAGLWNHGTTVAGGYIYTLGGEKSADVVAPYVAPGADTFLVPAGVTEVTVKTWGAGGGGGGGSTSGNGGAGGGAGFAEATITTTPGETLNVVVGGGGGAGSFSSGSGGANSGDGGGGGGHSEVNRSGSALVVAGGGAGGGGGDNSSGTTGGLGGAGGGTNGVTGNASSSAPGGVRGTQAGGGAGGNGSGTDGTAGSSEQGGLGGNGGNNDAGKGAMANGGVNGGGAGGRGDETGNGFGGGGGGGGGYFGGGGGSASISGNAGGGGGGGGSGRVTGTSTTLTAGSGSTPANNSDTDRSGAGEGGSGGSGTSPGTGGNGTDGKVIISYTIPGDSGPQAKLYWAEFSTADQSVVPPNPGTTGACAAWCTDSSYDLPEPRVGASVYAYNGYLYVIGGLDDLGARQSSVYITKLGANGEPSLWHPTNTDPTAWDYWYEDTGLSGGVERSYTSIVAYNNRMYVLGGSTNASSSGVTTAQYADINPNGTLVNWTNGQALPNARFNHSVQSYNDVLYLIGGNSSGTLQNTVYYSKLNSDGSMNPWQSTKSFTTARATMGGSFSTIWGAYMYIGGGCSTVNGSGYCTNIASDMQVASINADGSLNDWSSLGALTNDRIGYSLIAWQNGLYRVGGCSSQNATTGDCDATISGVDYGVINPAGEVSTVNVSTASGSGTCTGGTPTDCDLPPVGDGAGQGGQLLSVSVILNGYLYNIGGCTGFNGTNNSCTGASGNVSYVAVGSDGSLQAPASCGGTSYGAWCVDSTNRVNGTTGIAASGITTFNNRIYVVGGLTGSGNATNIWYNSPNTNGSFSGAWSTVDMTSAGIAQDVSYTYAYSRANPASAGSNPGNLYVFGGCTNAATGAGCSGYTDAVYKCNIQTSGAVSGCTTSGQLQIGTVFGSGSDGLAIHSGTVYANYIYLIGGVGASDDGGGIDSNGDGNFTNDNLDLDEIRYARFDNSNNVVAASGSEWTEIIDALDIGRRRGWAFGYNGHIYAVGGYDATGGGVGGVLPFIEWGKINVSNGSTEGYQTSSVEITQRWGLSMAVSNSYAYVIGGCDNGASPGECDSYEPSVQTFQLYNNDSGSVADFTAQSDQTFTEDTDRWGASSVVHNGYLYVAGGCTSATDCTATTDSVQYAPISATNGAIGTWVKTGMNLPRNRGWGHLAVAGDTLYWVGGQDSAGDEKSDVYYAIPETSSGPAEDVIRTTSYKINGSVFSGATYTLSLNNDLSENYYVMINGATDNTGTTSPDRTSVRVDGDPFAALGSTTADDELLLRRGTTTNNWVGSVTVVECLKACGTQGFQLKQVVDQSLSAGAANTLQTVDVALSEPHTTNTVFFGGQMGGGIETTGSASNDFATTLGVRLQKQSTNQVRMTRYGGGGRAPASADITVYVVEWGSAWGVQEVNFNNWDAGGDMVDATGEYATQAISSVNRANTWLWKSAGTSDDDGLGDGALGKVLTLGDGVNENGTESTVALGSYYNGRLRNDTVYVMTHSGLANDYRFKADDNDGNSFSQTVDAALASETYATAGSIDTTEGYRISQYYHSDTGSGTAFPRVSGWAHQHTGSTTISATKGFGGNEQAGWWQSTDFSGITYTPTTGDTPLWLTASNGLPGDRTRAGVTSWNDRIYVVGGLNDSATATNTVYVSPQLSSGGDITSAWATSTAFNVARSGGAVTAYANNLYLFGGYTGSNYLSDSQYTQINADGTVDAWSYTKSLPGQLSDARAVSANGYIYLVGGRSAAATCTPKTVIAPVSANTTIASGNNPTGIGEWYETNVRYSGDRYGAAVAYDEGKIYTMGGGCTSPLSSNRHYQSTVNSQPQVAIYSRLIDTDTDVFPNSWLLNGLDNSIGARWQVRYRSMNDTDGIATDCGTADMSTWGQDTNFGDTTLGIVNPYVPKDGSGNNTNCARYFYFFISIDASKTFGYPEDVNRGPTIADLSLFFTSDPNKRLRHGKTFTGGEEQPLDTPCRITLEQPNCPLN